MAISDTITSMYENVGNVYDVLELAGADLTNVDKNILNLKQTWEERLLYFLANGTDTLWNNWLPKVSGSGETITLNNTIEAKMDFVYKGNTYQYSTTGKNLFNPSYAVYYCSVSGNEITLSGETDFYINGGYSYSMSTIFEIPQGNYRCITTNSNVYVSIYGIYEGETTIRGVGSNTTTPFNATSTLYVKGIRVRSVNGNSLNGTKVKIYLGTGSEYEEYTGGIASPSPDYPQDIQVVSGDNTIKVEGQQLFQDEYIGVPSADNINVILSAGTYTLSTCDSNNFGKNVYARLFDSSGSIITTGEHMTATSGGGSINWNFSTSSYSYYGGSIYSTITFTIDNDYQLNIGLLGSDSTRKVMLVKGSEVVRTYQPYQSQSYPINLGVENLFDKTTYPMEQGSFDYNNGNNNDSDIRIRSPYFSIKPNTTYTISCNTNIGEFAMIYKQSDNITLIRGSSTNYNNQKYATFTTPSNAYYMKFRMGNQTNTKTSTTDYEIQLEEGSKANSYTPYGTTPIELCKIGDYQDKIYKDNGKWYLNKQIGKVVLDGSEDWSTEPAYSSDYKRYVGIIFDEVLVNNRGMNNYFTQRINQAHGDYQYLYIQPNTRIVHIQIYRAIGGSLDDFKTWLSTHNTIVYYVLATPTTTEITDTTLISQLEAIKKSYNEQTNISQTNNDMPFELDVTGLSNS